MTAAAFANLVHARLIGRGRWQAKCPAHPDRSPSLAIQAGTEDRTLVRCWAGCETAAVLAALSLTWSDLFSGEPPSPQAAEQARRERAERLAVAREQASAERRLADIMRRAGLAVDAIAAKLARIPDGHQPDRAERLAKLLHTALHWHRAAEAGFGHA